MTDAINQDPKDKNVAVEGSEKNISPANNLKKILSEKLLKRNRISDVKGQVITGKDEKKPLSEQTERLYNIEDLTTNLTPKKIIKLAAIVILLILIVLALYVKFIKKTPVKEATHLLNAPTPSNFTYPKYKPSIYADDPNFRKIDEGVSVLSNEIKNIQLEEKDLLPPSLDFGIEFK